MWLHSKNYGRTREVCDYCDLLPTTCIFNTHFFNHAPFLLFICASELKEHLLARSSRVDDIERLKQEFGQQRRDLKEHNEMELENLRTYFEQRLRSSEESHREEIALLQLRLVERALEESVLKTGDARWDHLFNTVKVKYRPCTKCRKILIVKCVF